MKKKLEKILVAPCGMFCALCSGYLAKKHNVKTKGVKMPYCSGCRIRNKNCAFIKKRCSFYKNKKLDSCFKCKKMPCLALEKLDKRYQEKFHMSMIENNKYIKKHGLKKFITWQKKKWTCQKCGSFICCHNGLCFKCDINKLKKKEKKYQWKID